MSVEGPQTTVQTGESVGPGEQVVGVKGDAVGDVSVAQTYETVEGDLTGVDAGTATGDITTKQELGVVKAGGKVVGVKLGKL